MKRILVLMMAAMLAGCGKEAPPPADEEAQQRERETRDNLEGRRP